MIMNTLSDLLDSACSKANRVVMSSICPRTTDENTQQRVHDVNACIPAMISDPKVEYVDNSPIFTLADGSPNDGYLHADGKHITRAAMNKLAARLRLQMKDKSKGVCKQYHKGRNTHAKRIDHQQSGATSPAESRENSTHHNHHTRQSQHALPPAHRENLVQDHGGKWQTVNSKKHHHRRQARVQISNSNNGHLDTTWINDDINSRHQHPEEVSRSMERCHYCAEPGHNAARCRHGQPIECYRCNKLGHKSKDCYHGNQ